jgi:aminoglycoside/choline kinase family phosphotransferase
MSKLKDWLETTFLKEYTITVASADASFRKYYRAIKDEKTYIIMDSSLELDSIKPFVGISSRLSSVDVNVPKIYAQNLEKGFLILEDFGNTNLLDLLDESNFKTHYANAIDEIIKMQRADTVNLPLYDKAFLHFEMDLMQEWYLEKKLSYSLSDQEQKLINNSLEMISKVVLSQPQDIFVHRDFHSRNIMLTNKRTLGVIDYQDAMCGAITYDLVSLLKDCYISFQREEIEKLALSFRDRVSPQTSDAKFLKWFDFMGLQRHIKVLGVFSRLSIRDGKDGYIDDIPLTLSYTIETALRYEETKTLGEFLQRVSQ